MFFLKQQNTASMPMQGMWFFFEITPVVYQATKTTPKETGYKVGEKIRVTKGVNKTSTTGYRTITNLTKKSVYFGT